MSIALCRAAVAAGEGFTPEGKSYPMITQCLAPASSRDGHPNCSHGRAARAWTSKFAPETTSS